MSQILLPHTPALPLAGFAAGPFGESSRLTALGGWTQSTLEKEGNTAEWMHRKQAKPALLPLSLTGDEGRRAARRADSSQELPENAAGHGQKQSPGSGPACTRARAQHRPRPRCPPTQLRQRVRVREATCEGKRAATASARRRGSPRSPLGPGARIPLGPDPGRGTRVCPPPRSRTWQ